MFPDGWAQRIQAEGGQIGDDFMVMRVPAIGSDRFMDFYFTYAEAG
jgi:hypothetical protein